MIQRAGPKSVVATSMWQCLNYDFNLKYCHDNVITTLFQRQNRGVKFTMTFTDTMTFLQNWIVSSSHFLP